MTKNRRAIGRRSVKAGKQGEDVATMQLRLLGLQMIDVIHTGWQVVRWINRAEDTAVVVPAQRVRGDRAAIVPGTGQRVLAEVKSFDEDRFVWSRLEAHQHQSLAQNAELGGLSLVVWVRYGEVLVMEYTSLREAGWKPGKGVSLEVARRCVWPGVDERQLLN